MEAGDCRKGISFLSLSQSAPVTSTSAFPHAASGSGFLIVWKPCLKLCLLNVEQASGTEVCGSGALNFYFLGTSCFT